MLLFHYIVIKHIHTVYKKNFIVPTTKFIKLIVIHFILVYLLFFGTYSKFIQKINNNYFVMLAITKTIERIPNSDFKNIHRYYVINLGRYFQSN